MDAASLAQLMTEMKAVVDNALEAERIKKQQEYQFQNQAQLEQDQGARRYRENEEAIQELVSEESYNKQKTVVGSLKSLKTVENVFEPEKKLETLDISTHLKWNFIVTDSNPEKIERVLQEYFSGKGYECEISEQKYQLKVEISPEENEEEQKEEFDLESLLLNEVTMSVNIGMLEQLYVVEFRKTSGDAVAFRQIVQDLKKDSDVEYSLGIGQGGY